MWTCAKCRQRFVNRNQWHSCGQFSLATFLDGKPDRAIGLLDYFLSEYRKIGDFVLHPVKTRVALLTKMRFCAINKLGEDFIDVHLVLTEDHSSEAGFRRVENIGNRFYIHHLRLHRKSDLTPAVRKFMRMAYQVGERAHVRRGSGDSRR